VWALVAAILCIDSGSAQQAHHLPMWHGHVRCWRLDLWCAVAIN
jgi:hypothetical protein